MIWENTVGPAFNEFGYNEHPARADFIAPKSLTPKLKSSVTASSHIQRVAFFESFYS